MLRWPLVFVAALAACATPERQQPREQPAPQPPPQPVLQQFTPEMPERAVEMVVLQKVEARSLDSLLGQLFGGPSQFLRYAVDEQRNAVLVYGVREETQRMVDLLHMLDVAPPQTTTTVLRLENVSAARVQQALQNLGQRMWLSTVDERSMLFRGTNEELAALQALLKQLDRPSEG